MEKEFQEYQEEEKEETLATPGVIDKYQSAGKIANFVLEKVIEKCVPGASVVEVCEFGDKQINEQLTKVYNKKKIEKGIAFPVCITTNELCGHFSPLISEAKDITFNTLKEGDVAKIDLGVHIDGYIALVAHTIVVQDPKNKKPVEGRKADVILAAYNSLQGALRKLIPGSKNNDATQIIKGVSDSYKCNPVEGVLSHELKKHLIDGNFCIINKETFDMKVEDHEFNVNEVFALDVIVSTGEGKTKDSDFRTTVYKRAIEKTYSLKTKHGRAFFYELVEKFPSLCFSMRAFEDEITTKLGVQECNKHDLLVPYPVLTEKAGEIVAQFKITVMILQGGTIAITGLPIDETQYKTENKIEDKALVELLATKMDKKSQQQQKKKKKKEQTGEQTQQTENKK